jgi:hypothetical protein
MAPTDSGVKLTTKFCDLHPSYELAAPESLGLISQVGDKNGIRTQHCTNPTCNRRYTPEYGYISVTFGELPDLELNRKKVRCDAHPDPDNCMFLTRIDGVLTWACPVDDCQAINPSVVVGAD